MYARVYTVSTCCQSTNGLVDIRRVFEHSHAQASLEVYCVCTDWQI